MYTPRRRIYYSKKYYRNKLFAPAMKKVNMPNYYQMKGRIIQQTPARVQNAVTKMITRDDLDKYYKLLQEYKYPFPSTPVPASDYSGFEYNFKTDFININDWPEVISLNYLSNFVQTQLANLPLPPEGYSYGFQLSFIDFTYQNNNTADPDHFSFSWDSSLSTSPQALITKTLTTTGQLDFNGEIYCSLAGSQFMRFSQVAFTQSSINYRFTSFATTNPVQGEDLYPFITTLENHPTYDASINILIDSGPTNNNSSIAFGIKLFFVNDEF